VSGDAALSAGRGGKWQLRLKVIARLLPNVNWSRALTLIGRGAEATEMKRWTLLLVMLALGFLAGCGGGGNPDQEALLASIRGYFSGWAQQNPALINAFVSADYAFDNQGKADHVAAIAADFPDMANFRLVRQTVDILSPNLASATVEFTMLLNADIASLNQPTSIFQFVPSDNFMSQVWIKDFDGVWRLGAEFLSASWVLSATPVINLLTPLDGDTIAPGAVGGVSALGSAASTGERVTLFPDSVAASSFVPTFSFGFGVADYRGEVTIRTDAFGEYSLSTIGQTDIIGSAKMVGRSLRSVFIVVSTRKVSRAFLGGKTVPGNKQSLFRYMRIRRAAGQYGQPRPGKAG
jgi:hypothetical protein